MLDLSQLMRLGISLPPPSAFSVELSVHDREVITFWLLNRLAASRVAKTVITSSVVVTDTAAVIIPASDEPRPVSIQNNSDTANLWLGIGVAPNGTTLGIKIAPGYLYESPWDFKEAVWAISTEPITATILPASR